MDWLARAKALPYGGKDKMPCCRGDRSAIISHTGKGYSMRCFRCGNKGFHAHGTRSIAELVAAREAGLDYREAGELRFPKDAVPVTEGSTEAKLWLLKNSLQPERAAKLGMMYSKRLDRVIIPISKDGCLVGIQCRAVVSARGVPKYLNLPSGGTFATLVYQLGDGVPVVTEDVMSAVAVSRVARGVSILGTVASMEVITQIAEMGPRAVVWLDNDKAGRTGAKKVARSLELQGVEVHTVHSDKDPKHYSKREMIGMIPWINPCCD